MSASKIRAPQFDATTLSSFDNNVPSVREKSPLAGHIMNKAYDFSRKFCRNIRNFLIEISGKIDFEAKTYPFFKDKIYLRFSKYSTIELDRNYSTEDRCAIITQKGSEIVDKRNLAIDELILILDAAIDFPKINELSLEFKEFSLNLSLIDYKDYVSINFNKGIISSSDITNISTLRRTYDWIKNEFPEFRLK